MQLIYNFGSVTATNYDRAQIYFDRNQTGGTVAGDLYYFDDYEKSNVAPQAEITLSPFLKPISVAKPSVHQIPSFIFSFGNLNMDSESTPTSIYLLPSIRIVSLIWITGNDAKVTAGNIIKKNNINLKNIFKLKEKFSDYYA